MPRLRDVFQEKKFAWFDDSLVLITGGYPTRKKHF
jgi:hypothetical protein